MQSNRSKGNRASWGVFTALWAALAAAAPTGTWAAPVETVLYSFASGNDGSDPTAGLIADNYGTLYGTTRFGGNRAVDPQGIGYGTVFKLTKSATGWIETVLYRFCPQPTSCSDGAYPYAGLITDNEGSLYGTTTSGGSNGDCVNSPGTRPCGRI